MTQRFTLFTACCNNYHNNSVGESVGVFAVPEQLVREVSPRDRFIVVASDGVFEFLTSQTVRAAVVHVTTTMTACVTLVY
jgi:serine/threonine protein phosphatase PrpC